MPSTASTTSQKEISSGDLLSLYPPLTPGTELTIPALDNLLKTFKEMSQKVLEILLNPLSRHFPWKKHQLNKPDNVRHIQLQHYFA